MENDEKHVFSAQNVDLSEAFYTNFSYANIYSVNVSGFEITKKNI